jgi:hypothetical protein
MVLLNVSTSALSWRGRAVIFAGDVPASNGAQS